MNVLVFTQAVCHFPDDFEAFHDIPVGKIRKDINKKERQVVETHLCADITDVHHGGDKYTFPFDY